MNSKKLSIVIPIYNAENYIERCVKSITQFADLNLEIILVNDGSIDNSAKICEDLLNSDKRIKFISKPNGGVSSARNEGLKLASGDFITFIDADDYVDENFTTCYSLIDNADIYCVPYCEISNNTKTIITPNPKWSGKVIDILTDGKVSAGLYNSVCMKIFKTELITKNNISFDTNLKIAEDLKFVLDCFKIAKDIKFIGYSYYNYFRNDTSAMHKITFEKISNTLTVCKYGADIINTINSPETRKLCANLISENILSVFASVNHYDKDQNQFLINELVKLKKYITYGSCLSKKMLILAIKILGIKNSTMLMKLIIKPKH